MRQTLAESRGKQQSEPARFAPLSVVLNGGAERIGWVDRFATEAGSSETMKPASEVGVWVCRVSGCARVAGYSDAAGGSG
jgi:hypothetical protein